MTKYKMTVFSEIPVHPITLDEVKGGLANPLGDCTGGSCNNNCSLTIGCKTKCGNNGNDNCEDLGCANKGCFLCYHAS